MNNPRKRDIGKGCPNFQEGEHESKSFINYNSSLNGCCSLAKFQNGLFRRWMCIGSPFEMNKNKSLVKIAPDSLLVFNCTISHSAFVWAGSQLTNQVQRLLMGTDAILAEAVSVAVPWGCSLARPCLTCFHHPHE